MSARPALLAVVLALVAVPAAALAGGHPGPPTADLPSGTGAWQSPPFGIVAGPTLSAPAVAEDADGGTAVAWRDIDAGTLHLRRVAADGTLGSVLTISDPADGPAAAFAVDVDVFGRAVIVWSQGPIGARVIRSRAIRPSGLLTPIADLSATDAGQPRVVVAPGGEGIAAWQRKVGGVGRIEARIVTTDAQVGPLRTLTVGAPAATAPSVGVNSRGDALVAFVRDDPPKVRVRPVERDGTLGPVTLLSANGAPKGPPQVVAPPDAPFVVTYSHDTGGDEVVEARQVELDGTAGPVVPLSAPDGLAQLPQAAFASDGSAVVAWRFAPGGGAPSTVQARRLLADGSTGPPVDVSDPIATVDTVDVGADPAGSAIVAWSQGPDVVARRLPAGGAAEAPHVVGGAGLPAVAVASAGHALLAVLRSGSKAIDASLMRLAPPEGSPEGGETGPGGTPDDPGTPGRPGTSGRDATPPVVSRLRVVRRGRRVRFHISEAATVTVVVRRVRRGGRRTRRVATISREVTRPGRVRVRLRRRVGRFRVAVTAIDSAGNRTLRAARRSFRVRRR